MRRCHLLHSKYRITKATHSELASADKRQIDPTRQAHAYAKWLVDRLGIPDAFVRDIAWNGFSIAGTYYWRPYRISVSVRDRGEIASIPIPNWDHVPRFSAYVDGTPVFEGVPADQSATKNRGLLAMVDTHANAPELAL